MAYELTKNLLGSLIKQQRDAEMMQQTPEFQSQVDNMFANRIEFARNQLVYERMANARTREELLEASKTVNPELFMKAKKEEFVNSEIRKLLEKPEQKRDYGLINYLASSVGYGDVGPIDQRPLPKSVEEQSIRIKEAGQYDRYYTGVPSDKLREQREYLFAKQFLDRGILYNGRPANAEQIKQFQKEYLNTGTAPEGFTVAAEPTKPQKEQRPTEAMYNRWWDQALELIDVEWDKLSESKDRGGFLWYAKDKTQTFKNLITLYNKDEKEFDTLVKDNKISGKLGDFVKLFSKYGMPSSYNEEGAEPSEYIIQQNQYDPNPEKLEFD